MEVDDGREEAIGVAVVRIILYILQSAARAHEKRKVCGLALLFSDWWSVLLDEMAPKLLIMLGVECG